MLGFILVIIMFAYFYLGFFAHLLIIDETDWEHDLEVVATVLWPLTVVVMACKFIWWVVPWTGSSFKNVGISFKNVISDWRKQRLAHAVVEVESHNE